MIGRHAMERHSAGTLFLATDFESVMSTNFITLASHCNGYAPMRCIIAMQRAHTTLFFVNYLQVLKVYTLGANNLTLKRGSINVVL